MADTTGSPEANPTPAAAEPAVEPRAPTGPEQTYYECGAGRKTFFCFVFILLLPFYVSLPVMLFQRVSRGLWLDTWQLMVLAILFTIVMALILFELIFSLRAELEIGKEKVSFTLPSGGGGAVPWLAYETREIPYDEIEAIESRREIYGGRYAPMMMQTIRIITKSGERIVLGRTNERDDDPKFPFPTIGRQIAARAGVEIIDRGNIMREFHRRMFGLTDRAGSGPEPEIAELNKQHNSFLTILVVALAVFLVLGIASDLFRETSDSGERGRNSFVEGKAGGARR